MSTVIAHDINEKLRTADIRLKEDCTFDSLLLSAPVLQGLKDAGFHQPSPIQLKAIPLGKCGLDLIIKAKSGTGKTLVFAIIALEMVQVDIQSVQVLILAPTREIADQIYNVIVTIGTHIPDLKVCLFIGGLPYKEDIQRSKNCHIAVGAPGRIKHLITAKKLNVSSVKLFVLDEADQLLGEDFQNDINCCYHLLPEQKQFLAISATVPNDLNTYLERYMNSPCFLTPETSTPLLLGLKQFVTIVNEKKNAIQQMNDKIDELCRLFSEISFTQCIVFCNYHQRAESICNILNQRGWVSMYVSSSCKQTVRLNIINQMKDLKCKILFTTNLVARGIDVSNVDLVINYDIPFDTETYLHRIGRSGRYGSEGICVSIVSNDKELDEFKSIIGDIGGVELGIPVLPSKISGDIWKNNLSCFEQIFGCVDSERKKVNWDFLESSDYVKKEERKKKKARNCKEVSKKFKDLPMNDGLQASSLTTGEVGDSNKYVGISSEDLLKSLAQGIKIPEDLSHYESHDLNSHTQSDTLIKNDLNVAHNLVNDGLKDEYSEISSADLLKNLAEGKILGQSSSNVGEALGEEIINPASLYPWVPVEESVLSKTNGKNLLISSGGSDCSDDETSLSKEILNKKLILSKNLAMYNITKIMTTYDCDPALIKNAIKPINDYLNIHQEKTDEVLIKLKTLSKDVSNNELCEQISYYSQQFAEPLEEETVNICKVAYEYAIGGSDDWRNLVKKTHKKKKEHSTNMEVESEVTNETECYNGDSNEGYAFEQYDHNTRFGSYYDYYENALTEAASTFEDVSSFNNWFENWQMQVKSVTNYVQQNLYLEEMNNYQYYNSYY